MKHFIKTRTMIESTIGFNDNPVIEVGDITLQRSIESPRVFEFTNYDSPTIENLSEITNPQSKQTTFAEAWEEFCYHTGTADCTILVGPGSGPITLQNLVVDPASFLVFDGANGRIVLKGKFYHRLPAMQAVKEIVASGGCPIAVCHAVEMIREWDVESVVSSEEVGGVLSR